MASHSNIDWSEMRPKRKPTRKERGLYQAWVRYLSDSRLTIDEIHKRAAANAAAHEKVPND